MANAFKSKNGFKILYTQISSGTLLTHREDDKRVRRGKDAANGATVIFWRLAGGEEDGLLALRGLLFDMKEEKVLVVRECGEWCVSQQRGTSWLITGKIQVPRLKTYRKVTSKFWNWSISYQFSVT